MSDIQMDNGWKEWSRYVLKEMERLANQVNSVDKKTDDFTRKLDFMVALVEKHDKVLYGDQEKLGEGGVINTITGHTSQIKGIGKSIDKVRNTFAMIWTGIFTVIQIGLASAFNYLLRR